MPPERRLEGGALASEVARVLAMREGEVAVLGLGRSGVAAARLLRAAGLSVYASDAGSSDALAERAGQLQQEGIATRIDGHDLQRIARASVVVVSPGIPPSAPPLRAAHDARVPVVSEIEVALRLAPGVRVIATTGTNGKTTTTALVGHLLRALGRDAMDAGNIGTPVSEAILRDPAPKWLSLELSSFQLHDTPGLMPDVGILTNLSPDHLDRYTSATEYYADKRLLFANATPNSRWVVTADSLLVDEMMHGVEGQVCGFSTQRAQVDAWFDRAAGMLHVLGEPLVERGALSLAGDHNVANALAALLAVMIADPSHASADARRTLADAIATFHALPHRLEPVHEARGLLWLNDSKATNVNSALVAIEGMTRPTVLLLGGRHKGESYAALAEPIRRICRAVIAFGEASGEIVRDLEPALAGAVPVHRMVHAAFGEVIERAARIAIPGDVILLSPACSSYDMFANFEDRGQQFAALAREVM
jgi:UDP-N-acetylmuramoylalanine--D-glutamate ligase